MSRLVAFLRAINTPPRHVKMAKLREAFRDMGLSNVETYIASGNVLFDDPQTEDLRGVIEAGLDAALGFPVPTFLRTAAEVTAIAGGEPFGSGVGSYEVSFLYEFPDRAAVSALTRLTSCS